jgi:hypothetical protein
VRQLERAAARKARLRQLLAQARVQLRMGATRSRGATGCWVGMTSNAKESCDIT